MSKPGKVFLAGAGPGDPGLLTQKTVELMSHCDVVCYDLLIDQAVLSMIPADKTMLPVGYRGYCGATIEYGMHPLVIEQALAGKSVLRLKAGDPFIFGRATEECRSLQHHGIEYEVIPGISSALGAAAYAGFPLTSNGMASDVTFASGHKVSPTIKSWALAGDAAGTLILYMGAKKLKKHTEELMLLGKLPSTPVAVIAAATSFKQRTLISTIDQIGDQIIEFDNGDPMLVALGEVVSLANELNWRDVLPLSQQQVLTCSNDQESRNKLKLLGATIVDAPKIEVNYQFDSEDWLTITTNKHLWLDSQEAAKSLIECSRKHRLDIRDWHWNISGSQDAADYLQHFGIFITINDKPVDHVCIVASTKSHGICGRQVRLIQPNYQLSPSSFALTNEIVAVEFLINNNLLLDDAVVFTRNVEVVEFLSDTDVKSYLITKNDSFDELDISSLILCSRAA
ncbi:uroporphyrinogen-III C-methyltransferase [Shewanella livingstonensis]|uniref:uroporphyrinogen-III C-methyltransferase n=1 Tax=Shewanella livingstonensis TaxID=150120 RepID=A0A3G8LVY7_9GAMM|nr:uroporphyrinogen-III C-methyltransferase [Shewanella livingstonensis]AZG73315.1 uroporphyrinogen-III C-methyltransferase [Shewanella livingstonensis]